MAAKQLTDLEAAAAALSENLKPEDIPSYGVKIVWEGRRVLLAWRNKWVGWDISVYSEEGELQTGKWDVYIDVLGNIVTDVPGEVIEDIGKIPRDVGIGVGVVVGIALLFLLLRR